MNSLQYHQQVESVGNNPFKIFIWVYPAENIPPTRLWDKCSLIKIT